MSKIESYKIISPIKFHTEIIGRDKNGRKIRKGIETCETQSGTYELDVWAKCVEKAAEEDGKLVLLDAIIQHVKTYAWMKKANDIQILILAAKCLTNRAYEHWEDFQVPVIMEEDESGQLSFEL